MSITRIGGEESSSENGGGQATLTRTLTLGAQLVLKAYWYSGGGNTVTLDSITVADNPDMTIEASTLVSIAATDQKIQIAHLGEVTSAGSKLITCTWSGSLSGGGFFWLEELEGGDTASWFDAGISTVGSGNNPSTNLITGVDNCYVVAGCGNNTNNATPGSGYTDIGSSDVGWYMDAEYNLDAGVAGSKIVNFARTGNPSWGISAASFSPAASGTTVSGPLLTHTYTAQVPQVQTSVNPSQVTHSYTAQAPQLRASVSPAQVVHTYTAQAAQLQAQVSPSQVTHAYTGQVASFLAGAALIAPVTTHSYTAQSPQLQASVSPAQVVHTYTALVPGLAVSGGVNPAPVTHTYAAQAPQLQAKVQPGPATHAVAVPVPGVSIGARVDAVPVTHTYTAQAPQAQASVQAGVVVHSYTAQVPQSISEGAPAVYGWGARGRVGTGSGIDTHNGIGSAVATDRFKRIGSDKA